MKIEYSKDGVALSQIEPGDRFGEGSCGPATDGEVDVDCTCPTEWCDVHGYVKPVEPPKQEPVAQLYIVNGEPVMRPLKMGPSEWVRFCEQKPRLYASPVREQPAPNFDASGSPVGDNRDDPAASASSKGRPRPAGPQGSDAGNVAEPQESSGNVPADSTRGINPVQSASPKVSPEVEFKNFHRLLCERFDYVHDERDWKRDQLSLIEWIAKRLRAAAEQPAPQQWQPNPLTPLIRRHMKAVAALFYFRDDGRPLAEREPSKDAACYDAFIELNEAGKALKLAVKILNDRHEEPEAGQSLLAAAPSPPGAES